jgi:tRNA (guanine-N7-)-methyltransferase
MAVFSEDRRLSAGPNKIRHVRSYVRREGRMTIAQKRAIEKYWHAYGVEFSKTKLDLDLLYHRAAPKILDIGTGTGEVTATLAKTHPENDYLAVEVHHPGVGSLIRRIVQDRITNIRISDHDVTDVLRYQLPAGCLDMVYIFFPDPWPKKRHHKRRLLNTDFLNLLNNCLKANGRIFIATDWQDLAEHVLETFSRHQDFINLAGAGRYAPRPYWRPHTRFEKRGQKLEHTIWDFVYGCRKQ